MVTGEKAFPGKSAASIASTILTSEPAPISTLRPSAPRELDRVVARCLAKDPDGRWQSARDLAAALRWISAAETGSVPTTSRRSWGRLARAGGGLVLTLLGIALGLTLSRRRVPAVRPPQARFEVPAPANATIVGIAGLAVSPDGERVVFRAFVEGRSQLYVRPLDSLAATPIRGTDDAVGPFWSPDGWEIAFMAE